MDNLVYVSMRNHACIHTCINFDCIAELNYADDVLLDFLALDLKFIFLCLLLYLISLNAERVCSSGSVSGLYLEGYGFESSP
jgi:hypothetical protein